jgi:hypothetical protein
MGKKKMKGKYRLVDDLKEFNHYTLEAWIPAFAGMTEKYEEREFALY